ncbi:unnamed protein product [Orchesella dallaii]|uniref:Uncharacterized protein n=1 Tax=Orchesella dallaii TaxID=48710 RepID=A0ABP1S303_9HEXA
MQGSSGEGGTRVRNPKLASILSIRNVVFSLDPDQHSGKLGRGQVSMRAYLWRRLPSPRICTSTRELDREDK